MTAAQVRERKLEKNFAMLDLNRDGVIDKADIKAVAQRFCEQVGEDLDSPKQRELQNALNQFWGAVDSDGNGQLSLQEYVAAMTALADRPGELERLLNPPHRAYFGMLDRDNDGAISQAEFNAAFARSGLTQAERDEAFGRLDTDHDGSVRTEELVDAAVEFYRSSDPDAPASYLNGFF
ncbi:MAG TPA: EF-hand domain-containing protein [Mycobacteriales bacterium]|nr:EF-hand domain-containing protein [Mycobacteriales bacterium]